jgi:hypothetical protein
MGSAMPSSGEPRTGAVEEHLGPSAETVLADHPDQNVRFYADAMRCKPDDVLISELHATFSHEQLERNHGFVQWLFPVYESQGMNSFSSPLTKAGAAAIRGDLAASRRVVDSYRLMLDFYGLRLVDERTGELARAENHAARHAEMNFASNHNWLRISRIIVSLGELGCGRYKRPLLDHRLERSSPEHLARRSSRAIPFGSGSSTTRTRLHTAGRRARTVQTTAASPLT